MENKDRTRGKRMMIDPPGGWKYGFPKEFDLDTDDPVELKDWLIENGYPKSQIEKWEEITNHCRYWYEDKDRKKH